MRQKYHGLPLVYVQDSGQTGTIQDFWLACQLIDTAEETNYNELAP
jgi:hypothetical protein